MPVLPCLNCGEEFEAQRSTAKFHSDTCRVEYARKAKESQPSPEIAPSPGIAEPPVKGDPPAKISPAAKKEKAVKAVADIGYTIRKATDLPKTTFVPTGFADLDAIITGFPIKRITEIYGPASVGKSSTMLATIANLPASARVLYIDAENALDAAWVGSFGISANMDIADPMLLEEAIDLTIKSLPFYDLIIFDSVASILFKTEAASEVGEHNIGVKAKLMTSFMRRLIGPLSRTNAAIVFINQEKPTIGDMYAPKWYTPGGKALEYAASLRLRLTSNKADRITIKGTKVGKRVTAEITKNKVGTPDRQASFEIYYQAETAGSTSEGL